MIKAVIFDMFETLVTLFEGRTYFSENIAYDVGVPMDEFRREWHKNEQRILLSSPYCSMLSIICGRITGIFS